MNLTDTQHIHRDYLADTEVLVLWERQDKKITILGIFANEKPPRPIFLMDEGHAREEFTLRIAAKEAKAS